MQFVNEAQKLPLSAWAAVNLAEFAWDLCDMMTFPVRNHQKIVSDPVGHSVYILSYLTRWGTVEGDHFVMETKQVYFLFCRLMHSCPAAPLVG